MTVAGEVAHDALEDGRGFVTHLAATLLPGSDDDCERLDLMRSAKCAGRHLSAIYGAPVVKVIDISRGKMRRILDKRKVVKGGKDCTSCSNRLIGIEYAANVNSAD